MGDFRAYLTLLDALSATLAELADIAQKKTQSVRQDDLNGLNDCMKQEQALSLRLRGFEQKRQNALINLGLEGLPLSRLVERVPAELAIEARKTAERLQTQYALFQGASEVARNTLECNLHEIEKVLTELGELPPEGSGYEPPSPAPPSNMRADFRA